MRFWIGYIFLSCALLIQCHARRPIVTDKEYQDRIEKYEQELIDGKISELDYVYLCFGLDELKSRRANKGGRAIK
jgi:hypothetical protein